MHSSPNLQFPTWPLSCQFWWFLVINTPRGKRFSCSTKHREQFWGPPILNQILGALFRVEAHHYSPFSAKFKNDWCYTFTLPVCLHGVYILYIFNTCVWWDFSLLQLLRLCRDVKLTRAKNAQRCAFSSPYTLMAWCLNIDNFILMVIIIHSHFFIYFWQNFIWKRLRSLL
jgi:hypothetical protein